MGGFADTADNGFDGPERDPDKTTIERMFAAHNGAKVSIGVQKGPRSARKSPPCLMVA